VEFEAMSSIPKTLLTEEEYLAIERQAEFRSEFYNGEMFALAGATRRHNRIVTNLVAALDNQLRERPCNVYSSDMRVRIQSTGLFTYPDVVVTCGEEMFVDDGQSDILLNPTVIIEVLSDSTEAYDRGKKFGQYQSIDSLNAYILVAQHSARIEQYVRQESGTLWTYSEAHKIGETIRIEPIECDLKLADVYSKTD
jgi:Uma2 family endonuclease